MHLLLLLALLGAPPASAAPQGLALPRGYELFYAPPRAAPGKPGALPLEFSRYEHGVVLDGEEGIEQRIDFVLEAAPGVLLPEWIPLAVVDAGLGERCELGEEAEERGLRLAAEALPEGSGFDQLAVPTRCSVAAPPGSPRRGARLEGTLEVRRPAVGALDALLELDLPVQPLAFPARSYRFAVESGEDQGARMLPIDWSVEVPTEAIGDGRRRAALELEAVAPLEARHLPATWSGRAPGWRASTIPSWDALAVALRDAWDLAAEPHGPVLPLAGRVLGQPDPVASVREAARIALDTVAFDASGGRGSALQIPEPAEVTVEAGKGRAVDRAALFVSLLRAAELRAEVLFTTTTAQPLAGPDATPQLDQVLVLVPGVSLEPGGPPLYVDPSRSSAFLGALDEALLGRDALLPAPKAARWLRLDAEPARRRWTWAASEGRDGRFQVRVTGVLEGAPAARVRAWDAAGRAGATGGELAWLDPLGLAGGVELLELDGGRLQVEWEGTLDRAALFGPSGTLPEPALPRVAVTRLPEPPAAWVVDTRPLDLELGESWTFRGQRSGSVLEVAPATTPFWSLETQGRWSGPVLQRKTHLRFTAREVSAVASGQVAAFSSAVRRALGGVRPPPPVEPSP